MNQRASAFRRWGIGLVACVAIAPRLMAADVSGLDLTIEVIGAQEAVGSHANRIQLPGVIGGAAAGAAPAVGAKGVAPLLDIEGVVQGPLKGTLNTVDSLATGVLGALGLGPRPQE